MGMKNKKKTYIASDFLPENLPNSRAKQFLDIVKNEWRTLLFVGFVLSLFFLPFIVSNIVEAGFMNGSASAIRAELETAGKEESEIASMVAAQMRTIHIIFNGANILCFMAFSIGLAGASRIIKCLCFGEGVIFKSDFFDGIKKYWKPFLLTGFLAGLFYFLVTYVVTFLSPLSQETGGIDILSGLTIGFYYAIIVPLLLFYMAQSTLYDLSFFKSLSNSLRFLIVRYYIVIAFALTIFAISLLTMIAYPLIMILSYLAVIILLIPFIILGFHLFALSLFDKYINKDHFPLIYRKGLYTKECEETPVGEGKG